MNIKQKIITVTICVGLLVTGCANYDWPAFGRALSAYGQQQQEIANQRNAQLRENARDINRQLLRNPNYWQEQRAQQEYYSEMRRRLEESQSFPQTDLFPFNK